MFEVTLAADSSQGLLLSEEGEAATTFLGKAQPIQYIAPPAIEGSFLKAHIVAAPTMQTGDGGGGGGGVARAGAGQGSEKVQDSHAQGYQLALAELEACALQYVPVMGEEDFEILLGESKYYYVVEKDGKRRIKETTKPEFPEEEEGESIIKSALVWGDNPVTITGEEANIGKRLGVYWETQKPRPDDPTKPLSAGLIRLVGRYWTADSVYKVKLETGTGTDNTTSIEVTVNRPTSLGTSRSPARDVAGQRIFIDDLCITYGGIYGIPPQFIKGQIHKEARYVDDDIGFAPSYRYEPYTRQFSPWEKFRVDNPYFVLPNNIRTPPPLNILQCKIFHTFANRPQCGKSSPDTLRY